MHLNCISLFHSFDITKTISQNRTKNVKERILQKKKLLSKARISACFQTVNRSPCGDAFLSDISLTNHPNSLRGDQFAKPSHYNNLYDALSVSNICPFYPAHFFLASFSVIFSGHLSWSFFFRTIFSWPFFPDHCYSIFMAIFSWFSMHFYYKVIRNAFTIDFLELYSVITKN